MSTTRPHFTFSGPQAHLPDFSAFTEQLSRAVRASVPTGEERPYAQTAVLFLSWSNNDMEVSRQAATKLQHVFQNTYNFNTETFLIPGDGGDSVAAERELIQTLINFTRRYDAPDTLLIYVYNGHAVGGNHQQCLWKGSQDPKAPCVDWLRSRRIADMAHADTLYILDCCYASRAAIDGNNELLAASSREIPMTSSLSSSFTYILAEYLESLAGQPVTVAQIHAHLLREAHLNRLSTTPVHATLTAERPCVTLYPQAAAQGHPTAFAEHTAPTREMAEEGSLRALVKVAIQGQVTTPTIQEWKAWLATNMLPYTNDIEIEAAFTSISSMLLISMPLEVWTAMADHPALELVDFVTSRNLLAGE